MQQTQPIFRIVMITLVQDTGLSQSTYSIQSGAYVWTAICNSSWKEFLFTTLDAAGESRIESEEKILPLSVGVSC